MFILGSLSDCEEWPRLVGEHGYRRLERQKPGIADLDGGGSRRPRRKKAISLSHLGRTRDTTAGAAHQKKHQNEASSRAMGVRFG